MKTVISFFTALIMFFIPCANLPKAEINKEAWNTNYTCVFVHGLGGWGEYDLAYRFLPYWGAFGGDLMRYLNARGFDCHAASVDPGGSAWDRACELYAQLAGTKVDYGAAHSARCGHERYGRDYTGKALIKSFSAKDKINLFGHSFGGATVLTFVDLLTNGSEEEIAAGGTVSELFTGGKADHIYSLTALASPLNGTSAYTVREQMASGEIDETVPEKISAGLIDIAGSNKKDGRIAEDSAEYDMYIDNAMAMLDGFDLPDHVYYFSLPCCATIDDGNGCQTRDPKINVEPLMLPSIERMGSYTGVTRGGYVIDDSWKPSDGLVNTISARAPFNAPQQDFDGTNAEAGIWNVYPTYRGDHLSPTGDILHLNQIRELYLDMIITINEL